MAAQALVFVGQGAQFVGMGRDLAAAYPECKALFDRADGVLGYPLSKVCFEGPQEELTRSDRCQVALFVVSTAVVTALRGAAGAVPFAGAAGLSLGEWTALHWAGVLSFEDALRVLEARGRFMQEACDERPGGMVSVIGLPAAKVTEIAAAAGVQMANINSEEQIVLSGEKARIAEAEKLATAAGARAVVLNVAGAYHSPLMASAAEKLDRLLAGIPLAPPRAPVLSNVTAQPHGQPDDIRRTMVRQVTSPVQWLGCVRWFQGQGVRTYVECGPGKVLCGLIKRIDREARLHNIQDTLSLEKAAAALQGAP